MRGIVIGLLIAIPLDLGLFAFVRALVLGSNPLFDPLCHAVAIAAIASSALLAVGNSALRAVASAARR